MDVICVCSLFRDSSTRRNDELTRYLQRMVAFQYPFDHLRFSFVEGDSVDNTYERLRRWVSGPYKKNCSLEKLDMKLPWIGSAVNPIRFKILSESANHTLDNALAKWGDEVDWYLWLESDIYVPTTILWQMLTSAYKIGTKFLSPMVFIAPPDGRFYDIYAYIDYARKQNFINDPPYHPDYNPNKPMRMFSVGSVMLMHKDVVKSGARWNKRQCIIDLCRSVGEKGFEIWMDPTIKVTHP